MSHNRIQMYKRKVLSKYNFILQEIKRTNEILEKAKSEIDEKVCAFVKGEDETLSSQFNKIDEELELFHNKLCIVQEELENGKLSVEAGVPGSLYGKSQEISQDTQNGTTQSLFTDSVAEQLETASSLSSQNDKFSCGSSSFHGQVTSQHPAEAENRISTKLSACAAKLNFPLSFCNESVFPNVTQSDLCNSQNNAINTNTHHSTKEINTEKSKISHTVKSKEHVSSSDGSSIYGTVSSVCSEAHTMDKSEMSVTSDTVKLVRDSAGTSRQNVDHCHFRGSSQESGEDVLETQSNRERLGAGVPYRDLKIGSSVTATVQDIVSPSDFWIQIDSEHMKDLCPVEDLVAFYDTLSDVKKNIPCLAPIKEGRGYFRAKILEVIETVPGKQRAKVLYLDLGCKGSLSSSTLRVLPPSLQKIPSLAVHCALQGVVPENGTWSHKAIKEFRAIIEVSCIKISICSRVGDTYFVNISVKAPIPRDENFTYNVAQYMCAFKYAVQDSNAFNVLYSVAASSEKCASVSSHDSLSQITPKVAQQSSQSNNLPSKTNKETFLPSKKESLVNNISHEQNELPSNLGHEICHNQKADIPSDGNKKEREPFTVNESDRTSTVGNPIANATQVNMTDISNVQNGAEEDLSTNGISGPVSGVNNRESDKSVSRFVDGSAQVSAVMDISENQRSAERNLPKSAESSSLVDSSLVPRGNRNTVSSVLSDRDSCNVTHDAKVPVNSPPCVTDDSSNTYNPLSQSSCSDFDWNVKIPHPSQKFNKKREFVVMLSAIVSPSDFYVNIAMPASNELDELQEHMLTVYQNFDPSTLVLPPMDMLCGMFCCSQFAEDKNWYRVQVMEICNSVEDGQNSSTRVRIQYIDYGNEIEISVNELLPLKKEFATHPPFSFHCSLAGIKPKLAENSCGNSDSNQWNEEAITRFKCLATFEKCYTAEIANTVLYDVRKTPIPVYLWDSISAKDILINIVLVEQGAADGTDLEFLNCPAEGNGNLQDLDTWDPMSADYNSTLNSYGVNLNDPEIATVGYKASDESYVCKFFSANGRCHRGDKCSYQHIFTSGDSTIDQEPVPYLGNAVSLPDVESAVFVMISAMFNPGHFFVVFPFGTKPLVSIYSEIRRGVHEEKDLITEFMDNFNKYYNRNHCRKENTAMASAIGDLVALKWKDNLWYRGRVCDVFDVAAPLFVYFVDFGNCERIERTDVYELEPQFRHFPFQAVECHLHGIEPKISEESQWSTESKVKFQELTEGKTLIARVKGICGSSLYVELFSFVKNQDFSICDYLVQKGYGQIVKQSNCNNSLSYTNSQGDKWNKNVVFIPA